MASQYVRLPPTVDSFDGRTGAVVPQAGDYTATDITNVPSGNITATDVQAAINELDSEKQSVFNPNTESYFFDDFLTGINTNLGWTVTSSGTGAGVQLGTYGVSVTQKAIGVLQADTGTTSAGSVAVNRAVNGFVLGYATVNVEWRFALEQLSTPAQRYVVYAGLIDNVGAGASVDGVYFVYADSLGPNWLCITRNNNVQTTIDSGIVADNVHNRFGVLVNETGTVADFYINGNLVATSTTNIPNSSARLTGIGIKIEKLIGTTASNLAIDYCYVKNEIVGGRN